MIENSLEVRLPIVSFIFDPWDKSDVLNSIDKIVDELGTDRIYHFTISPDWFSAEDVVLWKFDDQYNAFFKKVKEKNLHVIFRTMHEMNGWWYPRSSNPEKFKAAWIHVRTLSRVAKLNEENILFDFSVNHRDMPTKWTPSQSAELIKCTVWKKWCYHFEDYYPWDEFVDVVWFTFYNRWKAVDNRQWLTPSEILYDREWKTYERIKALNKPIIIDEVATTSVRYKWGYNFEKSRNEYLNDSDRKDQWLYQLWEFLINHPEIVAILYFNTDYTHWLTSKITWEADWAIVNIVDNKVYNWFSELEMFWEKDLNTILKNNFHTERIIIEDIETYISPTYSREINFIKMLLDDETDNVSEKLNLVRRLQKIDFKSKNIDNALSVLWNVYDKVIQNQAQQETSE